MSEQKFLVAPYDSAQHRAALAEFLSAVYAPTTLERRMEMVDWIECHHPHKDRAPMRFVVMDGEKVAATMGHLPADFLVRGVSTPVRFTHDLLVDPSYRGKGLAKLIVNNSLANDDFLPGGMWMTGPCYKLHLACGFEDAKPLVTRTLVLDPGAFTARKQLSGLGEKLGKTALGALKARVVSRAKRTVHGAGEYEALRVGELDPQLDGDWRGMAATYGATLARNAAHVNWKYARHPILDYRILVARSGAQTKGFIVWRCSIEGSEERRAVIADFLVENGDARTLEFLVSHAIVDAADSGMEVISALTSQAWAQKLLRSYGFLPRGESHAWVIGGAAGRIPGAWIADHDPWHVCMGDSDGDMWTGSA